MAQSTGDLSELQTLNVYIDRHDDFDETQLPVSVPVGYDEYAVILHLPDGQDIAFMKDEILDLFEGEPIYYSQLAKNDN